MKELVLAIIIAVIFAVGITFASPYGSQHEPLQWGRQRRGARASARAAGWRDSVAFENKNTYATASKQKLLGKIY